MDLPKFNLHADQRCISYCRFAIAQQFFKFFTGVFDQEIDRLNVRLKIRLGASSSSIRKLASGNIRNRDSNRQSDAIFSPRSFSETEHMPVSISRAKQLSHRLYKLEMSIMCARTTIKSEGEDLNVNPEITRHWII